MKRLVLFFPIIFAIILLSSCAIDLASIEDYEWKMSAVMSASVSDAQDERDFVIAVGEEDAAHPDAKIVELVLTANDGILTLTDASAGKTHNGTYKITAKTPKSIDYEVTIDGIKGYATVAPTKYYDGSEVPTLPISIGDYSLYFIPKN